MVDGEAVEWCLDYLVSVVAVELRGEIADSFGIVSA